MSGKLIGVGIGPGGAEHLTLAAVEAVKKAAVIVHIHAHDRPGLAISVVRKWVRDDVEEIAIPVPMGAHEATRRGAYDAASAGVRAHLDQGRDVIFVCEGDALFYGSFQYVMERLQGDYEIEILPGVTSPSAAAAAAGMALTRGDDVFQVVPATLPEGVLMARLGGASSAVSILKLGRHVDKVKTVLRRLGRLNDAVLVEKATWSEQKVVPFADFEGEAAYFSQVLVPVRRLDEGCFPPVPKDAVVLCLNAVGLATAQALRQALPGAVVWGLNGRLDMRDVDRVFDNTSATLRTLFQDGTPIVAVMATGIVVRALGSLVEDKRGEPPVVAVSFDGTFAVPVLGGHGGANRLAEDISRALGGFAAITTTSDRALDFAPGLALDEPPERWSVANPKQAKALTARRLGGGEVGLSVESGDAEWLQGFAEGTDVLVTHRAVAEPANSLILHPPTLALGVGCERDCAADELLGLVEKTLKGAKLAPESIACIASLDLKADEVAVSALAAHFGVPARFFTADELVAEEARLKNPSSVVAAEVGCPGVAEGAALASVGAAGTLLVEKHKSRRATCAVALSPADIDPVHVGRGRGRLYILGIGPGAPGWRTPEVGRILSAVTDVVGYGLYLDLVADLIKDKRLHNSDLSQEEIRVRHALDLAAQGRDVALISSGDVGIYAMATLAFELLEREDRDEWNRLEIQVEPGISAFQAAAARIGAPVGHDFCLISLSDLLTPWEVIERRVRAAAQGGFVVAFYNPVSQRRRTQLARACEILLQHRTPETPVVLARQLGREEENIRVTTLADVTPDDADMLTLVMVGGEDTRTISRGGKTWVYTPRGYGVKMDAREKKGATS